MMHKIRTYVLMNKKLYINLLFTFNQSQMYNFYSDQFTHLICNILHTMLGKKSILLLLAICLLATFTATQ